MRQLSVTHYSIYTCNYCGQNAVLLQMWLVVAMLTTPGKLISVCYSMRDMTQCVGYYMRDMTQSIRAIIAGKTQHC